MSRFTEYFDEGSQEHRREDYTNHLTAQVGARSRECINQRSPISLALKVSCPSPEEREIAGLEDHAVRKAAIRSFLEEGTPFSDVVRQQRASRNLQRAHSNKYITSNALPDVQLFDFPELNDALAKIQAIVQQGFKLSQAVEIYAGGLEEEPRLKPAAYEQHDVRKSSAQTAAHDVTSEWNSHRSNVSQGQNKTRTIDAEGAGGAGVGAAVEGRLRDMVGNRLSTVDYNSDLSTAVGKLGPSYHEWLQFFQALPLYIALNDTSAPDYGFEESST